MTRFPCPYLKGEVEWTEERERHIAERHPDLLPLFRVRVGETLSEPDQVRRSTRFGSARIFSRWYHTPGGGKCVVVVVVSDPPPSGRHWIVTAYMARKLAGGAIEWKRS